MTQIYAMSRFLKTFPPKKSMSENVPKNVRFRTPSFFIYS
jgi:hypothetical protein